MAVLSCSAVYQPSPNTLRVRARVSNRIRPDPQLLRCWVGVMCAGGDLRLAGRNDGAFALLMLPSPSPLGNTHPAGDCDAEFATLGRPSPQTVSMRICPAIPAGGFVYIPCTLSMRERLCLLNCLAEQGRL